MKLKLFCLLTAFFAIFPLSAQIAIQIEPARPLYMMYDAVLVRAVMRNYSSHPIAFGNSKALQGDITFRVITPDLTVAKPIYDKSQPFLRGIILAPGETRTFSFNLHRYFSLQDEGLYTLRLTIKHPQLPSTYESNETSFKIRKGRVLWQRKFGLPDYTGEKKSKGKIENRTYKLMLFSDGRSTFYYMMIDDSKKVYAIRKVGFDMGPNLPPQREIDALARFHLLLAVTPKIFVHYIYNFNGVLEKRSLYLTTTSSPVLVLDPKTGGVKVDGGRLALKDVDYDTIKDLPLLDNVKKENSLFDAEQRKPEED